jgi:hypothetical protein
MGVKAGADQVTVVHKESGGTVTFMPDVCLTPAPPGPPVPVPYCNAAVSKDADRGAKSVTIDGNPVLVQGSCFSKSTGDEAGCAGGVASATTKGAAEFIGGSFDVFAEGKGVARFGDLMLGNKGGGPNTPPSPEVQQPQPAAAVLECKPDSLEVLVVDGADKPLGGVEYALETPDGQKAKDKTDRSGKIQVKKTMAGTGRIAFPKLPSAMIERWED